MKVKDLTRERVSSTLVHTLQRRARLAAWQMLFLLILCGADKRLAAQADLTAVQQVTISAFALVGGTYTGLSGAYNHLGGRNLPLTAGVDIGLLNLRHVDLAVEARGIYPLFSGEVDGQKAILGGVRASHTFDAERRNSITTYVDGLGGRGSIHYVNGGYPVPPVVYIDTSGNVLSLGGGLQVRLTSALSFVAEAQFQRWSTPVLSTGTINAEQGSVGVAYRFGANPKPR